MPAYFEVGDVVRKGIRWGPRPTSFASICPGCHRFVGRTQSHCQRCALTFVDIAPGHVQIIGTRHAS